MACSGGQGRTGTALACLVIIDGVPASDAVNYVRHHYNPRAVETPWQRRYVRQFHPVVSEAGAARRRRRPLTDPVADEQRPRGRIPDRIGRSTAMTRAMLHLDPPCIVLQRGQSCRTSAFAAGRTMVAASVCGRNAAV